MNTILATNTSSTLASSMHNMKYYYKKYAYSIRSCAYPEYVLLAVLGLRLMFCRRDKRKRRKEEHCRRRRIFFRLQFLIICVVRIQQVLVGNPTDYRVICVHTLVLESTHTTYIYVYIITYEHTHVQLKAVPEYSPKQS